jgi:hypothetical protein
LCQGQPKFCNQPPPPECFGRQVKIFGSNGQCQEGDCVYPEILIDCDQPPAPHCLEGQLLVSYDSNGQCQQGACEYPETVVDCEHGCSDGACESSGEPVVLSSSHPGWIEQDCFKSGCHAQAALPPNHQSGIQIPACASCHGANGACYTCGRIYSCSSCHGYKHGFTSTGDCRTCHEAFAGLRNCY